LPPASRSPEAPSFPARLARRRTIRIVGKNDFEAQFRQVFENLGTVLDGLGISFDHVAKFTTYFVHSQDIEKFMALRAELFRRSSAGSFPRTRSA
jgi:enamine deaminase RidA (YjgF/YER057c/UK114 family)